jgi:hypothetical protein
VEGALSFLREPGRNRAPGQAAWDPRDPVEQEAVWDPVEVEAWDHPVEVVWDRGEQEAEWVLVEREAEWDPAELGAVDGRSVIM